MSREWQDLAVSVSLILLAVGAVVALTAIFTGTPTSWRWNRRRIGGHWEMRRAGSMGEYEYWERQTACSRFARDPWQKGGVTCEQWPILDPWLSLFSVGRHWQYLSYVVRHKWFVFRAGWRLGVTWAELWLCALHDNNKFHPVMWFPYAAHFYEADGQKRTRVAADGFYEDEPDDLAFDKAWLWHIKRSKHHPQHWVKILSVPCMHWPEKVLLNDDGGATCLTCGEKYPVKEFSDPGPSLRYDEVLVRTDPMPIRYVTEMICDWIGAGLAQGNGDTLGWYKARGYKHPFHPSTRALVEQRIGYVPQEAASA